MCEFDNWSGDAFGNGSAVRRITPIGDFIECYGINWWKKHVHESPLNRNKQYEHNLIQAEPLKVNTTIKCIVVVNKANDK